MLWQNVDPEIRYACNQVLDHLGIPYSEVNCLKISKNASDDARHILILPESSKLEAQDIDILLKSTYSLILIGHIPKEMEDYLNCKVVGNGGKDPPRVAGYLRVKGIDTVPFFYRFPVLELQDAKLRRLGEIKDEEGIKVGAVIGVRAALHFVVFAPQLFRSVSYFLAGSESTLPHESVQLIDELGRIEGRKTEIFKRGFLRTPIVNVYEKLLLQTFLEFSNERKEILVHKWFHPKSYDMTFCIAHDVEGIVRPDIVLDTLTRLKKGKIKGGFFAGFLGLMALMSMIACRLHLTKSKNSLRLLPTAFARKLMEYNPSWNFDKYVSIEKPLGATSAFYFLNNSSREDSDYSLLDPLIIDAIGFLKKRGFEIGLHGSFYSCSDYRIIKKEKSLLEKASGEQIFGTTQHFMRIRIPETWHYQESVGLLYDASLGFHEVPGFRAGICLPFRPFSSGAKKTMSFLEIPLTIMDGTFFQRVHMNISSEKAFEICKEIAETTSKYNGVLGLQWHHSIDREKDAPWFNLYHEILTYCLKFNPWYANGRQVTEWWNLRTSTSFEYESRSDSKSSFYIRCPKQINDFSVSMYIPEGYESEVYFNGLALDKKNTVRKGDFSLFSVNLLKGRNHVEIHFSKSQTTALKDSPLI